MEDLGISLVGCRGVKRSEFDHAFRAAGSILGESEILIGGSRAVHGLLTQLKSNFLF